MLEFWGKLSPETHLLIYVQLAATGIATAKAYFSSKKATFFQRAHEAVVVGIENSDCEDCRRAAQAVAIDLGIEKQVQPIVRAIKANS